MHILGVWIFALVRWHVYLREDCELRQQDFHRAPKASDEGVWEEIPTSQAIKPIGVAETTLEEAQVASGEEEVPVNLEN